MKTLVTGGTGLVGSTIDADIKLSTKDVDLRDWNKTLELFEKYQDLKVLLDKVETRKVIIPVNNFIDTPRVLDEAIRFEELYVMTKKAYLDRRIKSELDRLTSLKTRLI